MVVTTDEKGDEVQVCNTNKSKIRLRVIERDSADKCCGFHLTRTKWDPYPYVAKVDSGSSAEAAGIELGDCVLEVNGHDVVGMRIAEIAEIIAANAGVVTLLLWNDGQHENCDSQSLCCAPMPTSLSRLSTCMSSILLELECPICMDVTPPPTFQCPRGHLICGKCRDMSEKCPLCRCRIGRNRNLLAEQIYSSMMEAFQIKKSNEDSVLRILWDRVSGRKKSQVREKPPQFEIKNKFLTRLLNGGKASSLNNLSNIESASHAEQLSSNLRRKKSLSSNDLYPIRRTRCVSSSSYSSVRSSFESLTEGMERNTVLYRCPFINDNCRQYATIATIFQHLQESHAGPVLQFARNEFTLHFPFPYADSVISVFYFDVRFFIKVFQNANGSLAIYGYVFGEDDKFEMSCAVCDSSEISVIKFSARMSTLAIDRTTEDSFSRCKIFISSEILKTHFPDGVFGIRLDISQDFEFN